MGYLDKLACRPVSPAESYWSLQFLDKPENNGHDRYGRPLGPYHQKQRRVRRSSAERWVREAVSNPDAHGLRVQPFNNREGLALHKCMGDGSDLHELTIWYPFWGHHYNRYPGPVRCFYYQNCEEIQKSETITCIAVGGHDQSKSQWDGNNMTLGVYHSRRGQKDEWKRSLTAWDAGSRSNSVIAYNATEKRVPLEHILDRLKDRKCETLFWDGNGLEEPELAPRAFEDDIHKVSSRRTVRSKAKKLFKYLISPFKRWSSGLKQAS